MNFLIFHLKNLVSCLLLPVGLVDFFSEPMASCAYTPLHHHLWAFGICVGLYDRDQTSSLVILI